ncbi:putative pre-mrna-splicing factor atp-dependent rna helicase deah5 [Quercus suber]|uniref:Pre-mrna-splicing factor atp-dependent rna helicase deah5 n=1 Tax=Quercus suber TaxID=58331 RepID=A0AAW0K7C4_QUESU
MKNIKFHIVNNVYIDGFLEYLPNSLVLLDWPNWSLSLPSNFCPQQLVYFNTPHSNISLLITLNLSDCTNLVEIYEPAGFLDKLKTWYLSGCKKLQALPRRLKFKCLEDFRLECCESIQELHSIYKFQNVNVLNLSTNLPRPSCNSFDGCVGYSFLQLTELNLFSENVTELDFLEFNYFPALTWLHLRNTSTITIHESFIKFTTLSELNIFYCKHFEEIQGLPQSLIHLKARNCPSWNPKSSNKILSQVFLYHSLALSYKELIVLPFPKYLTRYAKLQVIAKWKQVGESQGVLADRVHEGERNQLHSDESSHPLYRSIGYFQALGCEIPDEFNHRNDGNSISFLVRNSICIPLAVCVAFGPTNEFYHFLVEFVVNGCLEIQHSGFYLERSESCCLWFISNPMYEWEKTLRYSNLSKQSHFEVICRIKMYNAFYYKEPMNPTTISKKACLVSEFKLCYYVHFLITLEVHAQGFRRMKNIKFLIVNNVYIDGFLEYLPNNLVLLDWPNWSLSLPSNFCPQQLVYFNMPHSNISLLIALNLSDCTNLVEIYEPVGFLDKLKTLYLSDCKKLQALPRRLNELDIFDCKHFEEIQGLIQSLIHLKARNCPSWNPKSSNKILSKVFLYHSLALSYKEIIVLPFPKYLTRYAKLQVIAKWKHVGESQGVLANRVHEGERNQLHSDESLHPLYRSIGYFQALGCEILDEFNHRNDGNFISFLVRNSRCIPLVVCVSFGPTNESYHFLVEFVVNGCLEIQHSGFYLERSEFCRLWVIEVTCGKPSCYRLPYWVIYHELVMTTKEYMREVMFIDPKWLVEMAPRFFKVADSTKLSKQKRQERIEPLYDRHHEPNSLCLSKRRA